MLDILDFVTEFFIILKIGMNKMGSSKEKSKRFGKAKKNQMLKRRKIKNLLRHKNE